MLSTRAAESLSQSENKCGQLVLGNIMGNESSHSVTDISTDFPLISLKTCWEL